MAQVVAGLVPPDGESAGYAATGRQFLEAFLTVPQNREDLRALNERLDAISEEGSTWRRATDEDIAPRILAGTPELITPFVPSAQAPDARSGVYRVYTQDVITTPDGETLSAPQERHYSVTVAPAGAGRNVVITPPAIIPPPERQPVDIRASDTLTPLGADMSAQLVEYLKLWTAAGPDATASTNTALFPYLAPDANRLAGEGLNGAVTFDRLAGAAFARDEQTGEATGLVDVVVRDENGAALSLRYEMTILQDSAGKLQVAAIRVP